MEKGLNIEKKPNMGKKLNIEKELNIKKEPNIEKKPNMEKELNIEKESNIEKELNIKEELNIEKRLNMKNEMTDNYLTNEQLQDLIAGVEENMYQAPDYLEQMILRKAEQEFMRESVEIVPIRHAILEGKPILPEKAAREKQFKEYSVKIVAAAAAILILLVALPNPENFTPQQSVKINTENRDTAVKTINQKTTDFCSAILEKTNQLFRKEDY